MTNEDLHKKLEELPLFMELPPNLIDVLAYFDDGKALLEQISKENMNALKTISQALELLIAIGSNEVINARHHRYRCASMHTHFEVPQTKIL